MFEQLAYYKTYYFKKLPKSFKYSITVIGSSTYGAKGQLPPPPKYLWANKQFGPPKDLKKIFTITKYSTDDGIQ